MDINILAFQQLVREGKAEIIKGIPVYEPNDLLDRMVKIRNYLTKCQYKCKRCPECKTKYNLWDKICLRCYSEKDKVIKLKEYKERQK